MAAFPAPGPSQDLSKLKPLLNSTGSHPVRGRGQFLFGAAAGYYNLMVRAAKADGVNVVGVSGHRTNAQQWELYRRWKAGTGNLAAYPGTSKHEFGLAADVHTNNCTDLKVVNWLKANVSRFRFKLTVRSECWHVQYMGLDMNASAPSEIPMSRLPIVPPNVRLRFPFRMKGDEMAAAQRVLVEEYGKVMEIDGFWGPDSDEALREVQAELEILVDGVWGEGTNLAIEQDLANRGTAESDLVGTVLNLTGEVARLKTSLEQALEDKANALAAQAKAQAIVEKVRAAVE
jgi:hypothetical protein